MCGIFGILQHEATGTPCERRLDDTRRLLEHRGPDGYGIHSDVGVGLVHTRLSLVDLHDRSNQPMWDSEGRFCLLYNGELYDYGGLRDELERAGADFRTTSDTEVLLEALIRLGVERTLCRIEGMFAIDEGGIPIDELEHPWRITEVRGRVDIELRPVCQEQIGQRIALEDPSHAVGLE